MQKDVDCQPTCAINLLLTSHILIIIFPFGLHTLNHKGLAFTFWWALASITWGCRSCVTVDF